MANFTENYKLKKPLQEEFYDIDDHNGNMDIIDAELKKRATLDETGKVLASQLPAMNYIPTSEKGAAGGVATLDENGKLKSDIFPEGVGGGGKRTVRLTVGSSQYGWTESDCDYLCDGTADEVEINAAIQALRSTGGEIVLLDGIYNLTSAIRINKDNVTLSGNGASTKIVRAFNDDEYSSEEGMVVITNSFCVVKNLYFDGVSGTYASNNAINLYAGDNCIIADNTIVNSSVDGIYVDGDYHTIKNNVITNCGNNGLYLYKCNKCVTVNNKIDNSGRLGVYIYRVTDSVINNNVCTNSGGNGIDVYWCDHCTFTGNTLNDNNQSGLALTRGEGNIISGNAFNGNGNYGVYLNSMSEECVVMSNSYVDNTAGDVNDVGTNNTIHLPSHTHDGAEITSGLDVLATSLGAAKIASGSYTGTGTSGSSNKTSITVGFQPKLVLIRSASYNSADPNLGVSYWNTVSNGYAHMIWIEGMTNYVHDSSYNITFTRTSTGLQFYTNRTGTYGGEYQLNKKDTVYNYVAIG
jgi:parallel beta-helix repeat protein